jgi:hypothetical protein
MPPFFLCIMPPQLLQTAPPLFIITGTFLLGSETAAFGSGTHSTTCHIHLFLAVLAASLNALLLGAPFWPGYRICSPEPALILAFFALMLAYNPLPISDISTVYVLAAIDYLGLLRLLETASSALLIVRKTTYGALP